jgi:hypothetical protein
MASTNSPYGLRPINLLGGQSFAGSTRLYAMLSGYTVSIQYGDPVILFAGAAGAGGVVRRFSATLTATTATNSATLLGVFLGCSYTDPVYGKVFRQNYPGSITASDLQAYVVDDPDTLFQAQFNGSATQNYLGANCGLIQTVAGSSSANINSGVSLNLTGATDTATLPIRVVDFVNSTTSTVGDAFTDVIVRINTHFMRTTTGNVIA